jgi:alpha-methylacyl-CoA racemase
VFCSISGYGQDGPYAQRAGHDINYIGYAGVLDQIGAAGGPPVVPNFQIGDLLGGALAPLVGLLAAVIDARASGRGRQVDVAMTDAVLAHAVFPLAGLLARLAPPPRGADLLSGGVPCYGVYATADGRHMAVGALEKKFWELLCDTLDRPDLKPFHLAFGAKGEQAKRELAAVFAGRSQPSGSPSSTGSTAASRRCSTSAKRSTTNSCRRAAWWSRPTACRSWRRRTSSPDTNSPSSALPRRQGQHSEEILREAGYAAQDIERLREQGII